MVPFMVTTPYPGPAARALGGTDATLFVGLAVAATTYRLLCRSLDLESERRIVAAEGLVHPH